MRFAQHSNGLYGHYGHYGYNVQVHTEVIMSRVSATEFKNNIGAFSDAAMHEPVIITNHQRDRLVLMSAEEYRRLTNVPDTPPDDRKRLIRERANYHRDTIIELAQR
tara:strand:+ start:20219 stop:20539 length:321 start_codon:yes stop_codon:yes gene_type:complete